MGLSTRCPEGELNEAYRRMSCDVLKDKTMKTLYPWVEDLIHLDCAKHIKRFMPV